MDRRAPVLFSTLAAGLLCACGGAPVRHLPVTPGGSVSDFDRGPSTSDFDTGSPAGAPDTIGAIDTYRTGPVARYRFEPVTPSSPRALFAGPPQTGVRLDVGTVLAVQRALAERGYYQGPLNGQPTVALGDALARFQADRGLPVSGQLDRRTADALSVAYPTPLPPRGG